MNTDRSLRYCGGFIRLGLLRRSLGALTLLTTPCMAMAQQYTVTDITPTIGVASSANNLNASGQVVGAVQLDSTTEHGYLITAGKLQDLGTLGGPVSSANGINSSGQVVGLAELANSQITHPFLYSNGVMHDLGTLGGLEAYANGINDAGQVVGLSTTGGYFSPRPFLYSNGVMQNLGTLGGSTGGAVAINASGQVTGTSLTTNDAASHAFLYSGGQMHDLGTLGGPNSVGQQINAAGQVTGWANTSASGGTLEHAYLYSNGVMQDLGTLGGAQSGGMGINASGQVTGWSNTAGTSSDAFLYSNGKMTDLNSLISSTDAAHYALQIGLGINDSGQILVTGLNRTTGKSATLLLTLVPPSTTPSISSWSPISGPAGTIITINGANLAGLKYAWVGAGHDATIQTDTATSVQIVVPKDASSGKIALGNGTSWVFTGGAFTVTSASAPLAITSWGPTSGPPGTVVTIQGSGLAALKSAWVGAGHDALIQNATATSVQIVVPKDATSGKIALGNGSTWVFTGGSFTVQ